MNSNPIKTDGFSGKIDSLSNFLFNRLENWKIVLINVLYWFTANFALKNRSYVAIFIDIWGQTASLNGRDWYLTRPQVYNLNCTGAQNPIQINDISNSKIGN